MKLRIGVTLIMVLLASTLAREVQSHPPPVEVDQEEFLDAEDWFQYGLTLNSSGRYAEAAESFQRSISIDPENPLSWLNLGTAQALSGKFGEAVDALSKATTLDPQLALGYANLGEVYFRTKKYPEALKAYDSLLALWPEDPNAHYKRGLTLLQLNDAGKAQGDYLQLKLLDPDLAEKLLQAIYLEAPDQ